MVDYISNSVNEIKERALSEKIPIMQDEGIKFLTNFIIKNNINSVLEIGTAIGYSSIMMALANPNLKIVTVERDEARYLEALNNIKKLDLEDRITLIFKDALDLKLEDKFDLIFLDAAKAQNINFFNNFYRNLNHGGYIITDNMSFHGFVDKEEEITNRNLRGLVNKIKEYKDFLEENELFTTEIYNVGDGIAVSLYNR